MKSIINYLKEHENKEMLRFITCGSVDDGKSTLIGRLLYDSKKIYEDQLAQVKNETKKYGTTNEEIDFALLVDGLQSEREQGITIDVAYRFFSTDKRKYIIADTPGHEQYTRNMATGASTADLAVILIDARKGVLTQTIRHTFIVTLMGIQNILIAINKMDLVNYDEAIFNKIINEYNNMFEKLRLSLPYKNIDFNIDFIPISALKGDNVTNHSQNMRWYKGKSLLSYLDTINILNNNNFNAFRYPVQYVNRPNLDFRGYCGTITNGKIQVGDEIKIYPSHKTATIKEIILPVNNIDNKKENPYIKKAEKNMAVTLTLNNELDISRGDLIIKKDEIEPKFNDSFEAMLIWFDDQSMQKNREYILKIYSKETTARVDKILYKKNINTLEKQEADTLNLNDIARVKIDLSEKIAFDFYEENKETGAFILIDKLTNNTVAAGMIVGDATKSQIKKTYTDSEIALNEYIRKFYPEWGCKPIEDIK
ncbi:sulfate adenylyltransferase subunit CysN [Caminibacter mediatlanticus TB-2]|uniref:Sulfate adenylyltransferase subunit 1 n=1 Tax=Caminibacter mediatlanticus TB-2 TaxID=391592 RepID=A0ABX5VB49_9BACT|nr:sulfate adenylyltransferase subunit CysN [Caminibacter mediatlanticus]QCT94707.1 sulfate adenylyltransferase subunit CysN [Caminibacter mediatlanticus TB-2]